MTDTAHAASLVSASLSAIGYTEEGLSLSLGPALAALDRGEPAAAWAATTGNNPIAIAARLFLLAAPVSRREVDKALGVSTTDSLIEAGLLFAEPTGTGDSGDTERAADSTLSSRLQIRPHTIGKATKLVFSDFSAAATGSTPGCDHVPGVGRASQSLLSATPTTPVGRVLDLGCGSGIQMLGQWECAEEITGTDVSVPALLRAQLTVAAARKTTGEDQSPAVKLSRGSWYEPVAGEHFDRITANPPFVIAPPDDKLTYRESGLVLDKATEIVASGALEHLTDGGVAVILGSWVHLAEQDWRHRIASWFPDTGAQVRVIQRDVVDPALYVGTWLRDGTVDPASEDGAAKAAHWLDYLKHQRVSAIGMGIISIRKISADSPTQVVCEDLLTPLRGGLKEEIAGYFDRLDWLEDKDTDGILDARYRLRAGLALEEVSVAGDDGAGFTPAVIRITRTDGPGFTHELDEGLAAIVKGLNPCGLTLRDTVDLYATIHGFDSEQLCQAAAAAAVDLIRHGMILPADLA